MEEAPIALERFKGKRKKPKKKNKQYETTLNYMKNQTFVKMSYYQKLKQRRSIRRMATIEKREEQSQKTKGKRKEKSLKNKER